MHWICRDKALTKGPSAPAIALVGPNAPIKDIDLLSATKEFYSGWMDVAPKLAEITASASRKSGDTSFQWEPFATLAFDAFAEELIISMRPDEQLIRKQRTRQRLLKETDLSTAEIENRLSQLTPYHEASFYQEAWDKMFMIDLFPEENGIRFGVNWFKVFDTIIEK